MKNTQKRELKKTTDDKRRLVEIKATCG